ncbi:MAG: hypothetical protein DHS20C16_26360 [Phycisphaerae bacterium]|nr:MAG: hypothetical protein DHS20C16_26360 [Phycisphaerae bacterium]
MELGELRKSLGQNAFDDLVAGVVCEAEHDAEIFCDMIESGTPKSTKKPVATERVRPELYSVGILQSMIARVVRWNECGETNHFEKAPPKPEVLAGAVQQALQADLDQSSLLRCRQLAVEVLSCWAKNFSWCARRELGAEVSVRAPDRINSNLDALAAFLVKHARLHSDVEGGEDDDSR